MVGFGRGVCFVFVATDFTRNRLNAKGSNQFMPQVLSALCWTDISKLKSYAQIKNKIKKRNQPNK